MKTELAQIVSLVSYGNEFIRHGVIDEHYFPENTVFQHCNLVDFGNLKKPLFSSKLTASIAAKDPIEWFKLLKKEKCVKLRLYYKPADKNELGAEYMLAGFVRGAGTLLIEMNFGDYSHYWERRWQVTNRNAADKKIWTVNYTRILKRFIIADQQEDISKMRSKFVDTLNELIEFCNPRDLNPWQSVFQKVDKILSDPNPNKLYYHYDLLVTKNYSLAAQQLLFAAGTAWVFGGMGSWNDLVFTEKDVQERYLKLSQQLYDQIIESVIAATNSF